MKEPNNRILESIRREREHRANRRTSTEAICGFIVALVVLAVILAVSVRGCASAANAEPELPAMPDCKAEYAKRQHEFLTAYIGNRSGWQDAPDIAYAAQAHGGTYGIDPLLIVAIMQGESGFRQSARGRAGEIGLMQIHPCWHGQFPQVRTIYGNVEAGCTIFASGYHGDYVAALGRYNTGGGRNPEYEAKYDRIYREISHSWQLWQVRGAK